MRNTQEPAGQGGAVFSRAQILGAMQALPFVTWERWAEPSRSCGTVYGWVNHPDRERDFVVLQWDSSGLSFVTSSAAHSREIAALLAEQVGRFAAVAGADWHAGRPVGEVLGDRVNRYAPVEPAAGEGDPPPVQPPLFGAPHGRRYLEGA
jgi:hypothetical protein